MVFVKDLNCKSAMLFCKFGNVMGLQKSKLTKLKFISKNKIFTGKISKSGIFDICKTF